MVYFGVINFLSELYDKCFAVYNVVLVGSM